MLRLSMSRFFINPDARRIFVVSSLTLITLVLVTSYTLYRMMQPKIEAMAVDGLRVALENKVEMIDSGIAHAVTNTKMVSNRIFLVQSLEKLSDGELRAEGLGGLAKSAEKILTIHFSGIKIYDAANNLVVDAGVNAAHEKLAVELDTPPEIQTVLLWDEQFVIRNSIAVLNDDNRVIGRITTEVRMPELTRKFKEAELIGKTGDFLLCAPVDNDHREMDCFLRGFDGNQFKRLPRMIGNQPLPMYFALEGQSGIKFIKDYRQVDVVAAHAPTVYGLGAVLKIDEAELNEGFIQQVWLSVLYLVLLVLGGLVVLYKVTQPLIIRLIDSRGISGAVHKRLFQAKNKAEEVSSELTAYINAIGKLALISVADRKGRILEVNDKFCEISGYAPNELIGKDHRILNSGFHPKAFWVDMWTKVAKGLVWHQEVCNRNKSGGLYWVDSTVVPLIDANGKIERFLSVRVDITAQKQKDEELKERLKESRCLHEIHLCIEQNLGMEKTLQAIMKQMILAFQFPEVATAKIELAGKTVIAGNFDENDTSRQLSSKIKASDGVNGCITVAYVRDVPFLLPYEQHLIDAIAHILVQWWERASAEQRVVKMATHDALTGLPNRYLLQDRIN